MDIKKFVIFIVAALMDKWDTFVDAFWVIFEDVSAISMTANFCDLFYCKFVHADKPSSTSDTENKLTKSEIPADNDDIIIPALLASDAVLVNEPNKRSGLVGQICMRQLLLFRQECDTRKFLLHHHCGPSVGGELS